MGSATAVRFDGVDTGDQDEVILVIDAARARRARDLDSGFSEVVRKLVMGVPVGARELDQYGIAALGMLTAEEVAERDRQADLFEFERAH